MPAQANQTYPTAGTVFNDGLIVLTLPGGTGITIGLCEEFSFAYTNTYKQMMGPGTYYPAAEAVSAKKVDLTIKTGVVDLRPLMAAMGATAVYASPNSTLTELMGDIPPKFKLVWKTPSDGTDITWTATNVALDTIKMNGALHAFNEADWTAHCLPDPNASTPNTVFTMQVSGNQTLS